MCTVVRHRFALEREAVVLPAARLLGFARPGEEQKQLLSEAIDKLLAENSLVVNNDISPVG